MAVSTGAISKANSFKIRHGILSGPDDLFASSRLSNFATPSWLSWSWSMSGYEWPLSLGMEMCLHMWRTCEDRSELIQHNLRFSLTVSVKHAMMLQWWYPEIVMMLRLHKFPEGMCIIILKALLDYSIYVLPPVDVGWRRYGRQTCECRYFRVANELPPRDAQDSALAFHMECLQELGICWSESPCLRGIE